MTLPRVVLTAFAVLSFAAAPASAADWQTEGLVTPSDQGATDLDGFVDAGGSALFSWNPGVVGGPINYRARQANGQFGDIVTIPSRSGGLPEYSHAPNGDAVAAWVERQDEQTFNYRLLKASIRSGGGGYGAPQTVFDAGPQGSLCWFRSFTADSGESVLIFGVAPQQPTGGSCPAFVAVRPAGSNAFGSPAPLASPPADRPQMAFDAAGNGLIAWRGEGLTSVQVARYTAGGPISSPQSVAVSGETVPRFDGPVVLRVSKPTGRAILGFPSSAGGDSVHVGAAIGSVTDGFGAPRVLSGPADLSSGQLGSFFDGDAGDDGTLALTWRSSGRGKTRIQANFARPSTGALSARGTQSVSAASVQTPRVVVTPRGRITVAWLRLVGNGGRALEAASAGGGRFSSPRRVSSAGVVPRPQPVLELNSRGDQFLVWVSAKKGFQAYVDSAKASSRSGRFGRVLSVLRTRKTSLPRTSETAGNFIVVRGVNGAMYTAVRRDKGSALFWDLRSYGER